GRTLTNALLSVGSGFFVDRGGLLITNEHVIRNAVDIRVRLADGRELPACLAGADPLTDIALLSVKAGAPVQALPVGDSDRVRAGESVVAIGSPFGFSHSATAGIVSAVERAIERSEMRGEADLPVSPSESYSFFIQTDALINVGNSGGPLLDREGQVIGVNTAFWGRAQSAQGVGFAIPINIIKLLLPRLRQEGMAPRSYLGVQSQMVDSDLARALDIPANTGALIAGVDRDSPAEAGGLEPGDVVTVWEGRRVRGAEDFKIYVQLTPPGTRVRLSVLRRGKSTEHVLSTRAMPEGKPRPMSPLDCRQIAPSPALANGFEVAELPPGRIKGLAREKVVRISKVSGGAALDAGLEVDDIILRVGRTSVGTAEELYRALGASSADKPAPLLIRRDGADFWRALPRQ
ncbi:MAG TPA: trypsin-like peptidase domain-containing protein, partial [Polyangia bacterium]